MSIDDKVKTDIDRDKLFRFLMGLVQKELSMQYNEGFYLITLGLRDKLYAC